MLSYITYIVPYCEVRGGGIYRCNFVFREVPFATEGIGYLLGRGAPSMMKCFGPIKEYIPRRSAGPLQAKKKKEEELDFGDFSENKGNDAGIYGG